METKTVLYLCVALTLAYFVHCVRDVAIDFIKEANKPEQVQSANPAQEGGMFMIPMPMMPSQQQSQKKEVNPFRGRNFADSSL